MLKKALLLTILVTMLASAVLADSDARPAKDVEKDFFNKVITACESAVAGIKTTWEQADKSGAEKKEFELISVGSENAPLTHGYYIEWADQQKIEKANAEISGALANKVPEVQANSETQELKELDELAEKIAAAAAAGNFAEVEKLNKQAEEIATRQEATFAETDKGINDIIERLAPRDSRIVVRIALNQFYQGFDVAPTPGKLADGTVFYRLENSRMFNEGWVEGTSYVLLGKGWETKADEACISMEKAAETDKPYTMVQSVIIAVEAEQKRATEVLNSMNLKALQALIQ